MEETDLVEETNLAEEACLEESKSCDRATARTVTNSDSCNSYWQRLNKLQDSSRKMKQRDAVLRMEVRMLRKANKEMQKVIKCNCSFY